ncbi:uncharacterized protein LOC144246306 [Lonchura striata]
MIRRSRQIAAVKALCAWESTQSTHTSVSNWLMDRVSCTCDLAGSITGPCDRAFQFCLSGSHPGNPQEWSRSCGEAGKRSEGPLKFQHCHVTLSALNLAVPGDGVGLQARLRCVARDFLGDEQEITAW